MNSWLSLMLCCVVLCCVAQQYCVALCLPKECQACFLQHNTTPQHNAKIDKQGTKMVSFCSRTMVTVLAMSQVGTRGGGGSPSGQALC